VIKCALIHNQKERKISTFIVKTVTSEMDKYRPNYDSR